MTKPTILCVPVSSRGLSALAIPLPSVGASPPHKRFNTDVAEIRKKLEELIKDEEKDVVLVVHSYTGIPGGEATQDLSNSERTKKGEKGGVVRVVYINALAMGAGFTPTQGRAEYPSWMKIDMEKGIVTVSPTDARNIFYNDLHTSEAEIWIAQIQHQSAGVYTSTTTYTPWTDIPSTFIYGKQDKSAITEDLVDYMIAAAREMNPDAFDVVEKYEGGHCLMLSRAEWLTGALERAAGS